MKENNEIWKDVVGYEGLYQVSNYGEVKSLNYNHTNKCKQLKLSTNGGGYKIVALYNNGKYKYKSVHRLVAEAFIPNPNNYLIINHIDENKINNQYKNLEWCTQKHNVNHGNGIYKCAMKKWKAVIQYTLSGEFVRKYSSIKEASIINKLSQSHIGDCCKGRIKTHGGYKWRLEND